MIQDVADGKLKLSRAVERLGPGGLIAVTQAVLPQFSERPAGVVVNMT
ncbi:hypothetical protein [Burkholderia metallica]